MLIVQRGQFLCGIDPCEVMVRVGDQPAQTFHGGTPDDHSTTVLFINEREQFMRLLEDAKTLSIAATFYQEGSPVVKFNVANFDPTRIGE
jgi:hypothetical protein